MPTIQDDINAIRRAVYGKDVREAIADGIEQCYTDVSSAATLANTAASNANTAVSTMTAAVEAELDKIPDDYTDLIDEVDGLKSALPYGLEKIISDNMALLEKLIFTDGYWKTDGTMASSTTTFHTKKITVTSGKKYYIEFPLTTTKIILRNFNGDGSVAGSSERTTSGVFTPTTNTIAFNAMGNAKADDVYLLDANSNLALKNETLINKGIISSGSYALSSFTDIGWYIFYAAVTVTDRPQEFPSGGFILRVSKTNTVIFQEIFPFDYTFYAYRIIGKNWNVPASKNKPYEGKTISIIGDSLSDKSNSTAAIRYYDVVDDVLGTTSTEYAMSGCGYKRKYNNGDAFYEQAAKIATNTDLVLIFGSFNDHNVYDTDGLGNITDTTTDTVFGCVNYTLQTIFSRAPKATVGIMLPTPWAQYPPYNENTLQWQYVDGIKEIAKRYSIPVLDLYTNSNMRPWDETFRVNYYKEGSTQDSGTHPNSAGHKRFAPQVVEFVRKLLEQV